MAKLLRQGHLCRGCPLRVLRGWLPPAQHTASTGSGWRYDVPSISSGRRAVAVGRAPRSQPRTNLLLVEIAKSLRQRRLSLRDPVCQFCVVDRDRRSQPPGRSQPRPPFNGFLRANMRGSGYIGVKSTEWRCRLAASNAVRSTSIRVRRLVAAPEDLCRSSWRDRC